MTKYVFFYIKKFVEICGTGYWSESRQGYFLTDFAANLPEGSALVAFSKL